MSKITITGLPAASSISSNTSNTLFVGVDIPTLTTGRYSAHTIAQGLYKNEILNVGVNPNVLPHTVAQFASNGSSYIQTNLVNTDDGGSADIVVTANAASGGTDSAYFIDMGLANKYYQPGLEFNNIGTSINPLDGYLYVQGLNGTSPGGNLIVGTTTSNTELRLIVGGGTSSNIVAKFTSSGMVMNTATAITFPDGTKQTTSAVANAFSQATYTYAQAGFAQANTANAYAYSSNTWLQSNIASTLVSAKSYTDTANNWLQANIASGLAAAIFTTNFYTDTANNWLQSNIASTLVSAKSYTNTANTYIQNNYIANNSPITVASNKVGIGTTTPAYTLDVAGKINAANNISGLKLLVGDIGAAWVYDQAIQVNSSFPQGAAAYQWQYGNNSYTPYLAFIKTRSAVPNDLIGAVQTGDTLGSVVFAGASGGNPGSGSSGHGANPTAAIECRVDGAVSYNVATLTGQVPAALYFSTGSSTATGGNARMVIRSDGKVGIGTTTPAYTLDVAGSLNVSDTVTITGSLVAANTIRIPIVYSAAQTAITVMFNNSSLIRCNTSTGLTVTLANFIPGKFVDLIVVNEAGGARTITHGGLAINSTVNSTSFSMAGTSAAYIRYFCIAGDLANTFVSVQHA